MATLLFAIFFEFTDDWAHAFAVVVLPTVALSLASLALVLRARARVMLSRVTRGRTGRILPSGHICFDDGELPARAAVRNRRVTPGPAIAFVPSVEDPRARVEPGLRGEALMRWRGRLKRWTDVAVACFAVGAAPLFASWLLDAVG